MKNFKDVLHQCPHCQSTIHIFKPFWQQDYWSNNNTILTSCTCETFPASWSCLGPNSLCCPAVLLSNFDLWAGIIWDCAQHLENIRTFFLALMLHLYCPKAQDSRAAVNSSSPWENLLIIQWDIAKGNMCLLHSYLLILSSSKQMQIVIFKYYSLQQFDGFMFVHLSQKYLWANSNLGSRSSCCYF